MKKVLTLLFILILVNNISFANDTEILKSQEKTLGISNFLEESEKYIDDEWNIQETFNQAITGRIGNINIFNKLLNILGRETKDTINHIGVIVIVIVVHSILVAISENLGNKSVSQIAYFTQYIIIITLIINNFSEIIHNTKDSIVNLVGFCNSLIPLLMTLMLTTGAIVSTSAIKPILLFLINFIGNFIIDFILPITIIGTTLGIVSKISNQVRLDKLAKFMKSTGVWILGIIMTLFVTVLSLEGSITETVDGVTAKTTKAAVSTVIPVVGKILGDAADAVIGCTGILKNAVGFIGIIIVIGICIAPIIKLAVLSFTYYLASCVCQPIADDKIISLLDSIGDTFKILLAIIFCIVVMVIVGLTIAIKVSNGTLLYR